MPINDKQWDHYHLEVMHTGSNRWRTYARWPQADKVSILDQWAKVLLELNGHYKAVRGTKVTTGKTAQPMFCRVRKGQTVPEWVDHGGFA